MAKRKPKEPPVYAFSGPGTSGATNDIGEALTWLHNSRGPAAIYIRLDLVVTSIKSRTVKHGLIRGTANAEVVDGNG